MASVVHFAVYADDPERAMRFYEAVFGWRFEAWGPPGYWKIFTGDGPGVVEGALTQRSSARGEGAPNCWRCTVTVPDADATRAALEGAGAPFLGPTADIPGIGKVFEFRDTEGNLACAMEYAAGDPRSAR